MALGNIARCQINLPPQLATRRQPSLRPRIIPQCLHTAQGMAIGGLVVVDNGDLLSFSLCRKL